MCKAGRYAREVTFFASENVRSKGQAIYASKRSEMNATYSDEIGVSVLPDQNRSTNIDVANCFVLSGNLGSMNYKPSHSQL